jgi:hypothetical protein
VDILYPRERRHLAELGQCVLFVDWGASGCLGLLCRCDYLGDCLGCKAILFSESAKILEG